MDKLQVTPPKYLKSYARSLWKRLVPILREEPTIKEIDRQALEALCVNYQIMRNAYENIQEHGISSAVYRTVVSPTDGSKISTDFVGYKRNPATQVLDSATAKVERLSADLWLTPAQRASLTDLDDDESKENMGDLLNGSDENDGF